MRPAATRPRKPSRPEPAAATDPHCPRNDDCQRQQVQALTRIADTLEDLKAPLQVLHDLADRLERLCKFLRRWGPWLLGSAPLVASIIGAVIPELAPLAGRIAEAIAANATGVGQ